MLVAAAVIGWNLLYTTTRYRPPEDKRVDVYVKAAGLTSDALQAYLDAVHETAVPEMELVEGVTLMASLEDYYATMQLSVYIAAGEGDIFILPTDEFKSYASQGVFLALEEVVSDGVLPAEGMALARGEVALEETGARALYGIPLDECAALPDLLGMSGEGLMLGVTAYNGNTENVLKVASRMLADFRGEAAPQ